MFDSASIIVGLEIGTSKVCAVVGEMNDEGSLNIVGLGQARSRGVRKGEIVDARVIEEDVRVANRLCHEVLGRSLDTLSPPTRRLLDEVHRMVVARASAAGVAVEDFRFSRREVREHTGLGHTQLKVHLGRLEELEYLVLHRGGRGRAMEYELVYRGEGEDGGRFVPGLVEPDASETRQYDTNRSGQNEDRSGPGRPLVGGQSGGGRGNEGAVIECKTGSIRDRNQGEHRKVHPGNGKSAHVVASLTVPARAVS